LPNRATAVETSPTSHPVTIPSLPLTTTTTNHYHHARPPPPPSSTPVNALFWANPGVASSIPPAPNDAASPPPNAPNDPPPQCHVTGSLRRQQSREPRHVTPSTPPRHPPSDATSPPRHRPPTTATTPPSNATSPAPDDPNNATLPSRTTCRMVGIRGPERLRGGEDVQEGREDVQGGRQGRPPGFSTTTRRQGAPPIPTSSSWLVPTACTTRRRVVCTPPRFLSFFRRGVVDGGRCVNPHPPVLTHSPPRQWGGS